MQQDDDTLRLQQPHIEEKGLTCISSFLAVKCWFLPPQTCSYLQKLGCQTDRAGTSPIAQPASPPARQPSEWVDWLLLPAPALACRPDIASNLTWLVQATNIEGACTCRQLADLQFHQDLVVL